MKLNDKPNYFKRYLKKKQLQFKAFRNQKEHYAQSTCEINSKSQGKYRKECLSNQSNDLIYNKQKLNHKNTNSTPIDVIIQTPTLNVVKYSFDDNIIEEQSNDYLLNFPLPNPLNKISEIILYKHIETVEKRVHDLLNIIESFEKENTLNYEPFKTFFVEREANTDRYASNNEMKKYISPPNSTRFNKTINNLSLSSKESTHYLSKKISHQINNNLNEAISKSYLDESSNTHYQYKSYSMKKARHNFRKLIGLKQSICKRRVSGGVFREVKTLNYHKPKEIINQSKVLINIDYYYS